MENLTKINENIYRLTMPYRDVYTTVYAVKTEGGVLLFDAASYDEDIDRYIMPFLSELGITADMLRYVFISHNHNDHSGGLGALMKAFPKACIISRSPQIKEAFSDYSVLMPEDNDTVLDVLKVVRIIGHTYDCSAVYDTRTKTLISGDSLQLYGLYGSGNWGANISFPQEHIADVEKLRRMDIAHILTAHYYQPYGYSYEGADAVSAALDACIAPLDEIAEMIIQNPDADDASLREVYNSSGRPVIGTHVVTGIRKMLVNQGRLKG